VTLGTTALTTCLISFVVSVANEPITVRDVMLNVVTPSQYLRVGLLVQCDAVSCFFRVSTGLVVKYWP